MNIVIVDDEVEIREGLRAMIERMDDGGDYRIVSVCSSGQEALEALSLQLVDVLLSDIRMARMDGLELIEVAKQRYPELQVVVLSGYSQFEYAQRAIQLDVSEYLLKPVREEDLRAVLSSLRARCEQRKEARLYMDEERFRREQAACATIMAIDENEGGDENSPELPHALKEIVAGLPNVYLLKGFAMKSAAGAVAGIYGDTPEAVGVTVGGIVRAVEAHGASAGKSYSVGISETRAEPGHAHSLYLHACTALAGRLLLPGGGVFSYETKRFDENAFQIDLARVDAAWDTLDFAAIYAEIGRMLGRAADGGDIGYLIWMSNAIMLSLNEKVQSYNRANEAVTYDLSAFLFKMLWCRSMAGLERFMLDRVKELFSLLATDRREGQIVQRAKQYIRSHLHEQLSLADIGLEVCVSASYLSRLFREQTGGTFLEYLTNERIAHAKELLANPGVKVYEVAERVGYGSWKHFSRTFKEATGVTPAEYRQNLAIRLS